MKWKIPKHVAQHSEAILTWVGSVEQGYCEAYPLKPEPLRTQT